MPAKRTKQKASNVSAPMIKNWAQGLGLMNATALTQFCKALPPRVSRLMRQNLITTGRIGTQATGGRRKAARRRGPKVRTTGHQQQPSRTSLAA